MLLSIHADSQSLHLGFSLPILKLHEVMRINRDEIFILNNRDLGKSITSLAASREVSTTRSVVPARRSITGPWDWARSRRAWCGKLEVAR